MSIQPLSTMVVVGIGLYSAAAIDFPFLWYTGRPSHMHPVLRYLVMCIGISLVLHGLAK